MPATHAQIAKVLIAGRDPRIFAQACLPVVQRGDHSLLERMLPGVVFASRKVGPDEWELVGTCADGSVAVWRLGQ